MLKLPSMYQVETRLHARFSILYFYYRLSIFVVFIDEHTPRPFVEDFSVYGDDGGANEIAAIKDHIYLDAMGLGMGCCCLQVTFQAQSIDEARFLYDQLTPLTGIMVLKCRSILIH
jgi:hypothetical protein